MTMADHGADAGTTRRSSTSEERSRRRSASLDDVRDRDAAGRARNNRPRDGLGRPLPHGADGVERIPDDLVLPPLESLPEAQRLLDAGAPFHAHEVLEGTWKAAPPEERELWRGLAQLAVGLTHQARGNTRGAVALLTRAGQRVGGYADRAPYSIDAAGIDAWAREVVDAITAGRAPARLMPPRLVRPRHAPSPPRPTSPKVLP